MGARVRAGLLRGLRLLRQVARRARQFMFDARSSRGGPGRSTSRSCTRCWRSTSSCYRVSRENGLDPGGLQVVAGSRLQHHGDRPGHVGSRRPGQGARDEGLFEANPKRSATADRGGRQRLDLADRLRRLPPGLRLADRGIADINIPPWIEDQASPLGQIRNFIGMDDRHDFEKPLDAAIHEATPPSTPRSEAAGDLLGAFNELLAINPVANFAWWNEDHNYYVDLRPRSRCGGARASPQPSGPTRTTTRCSSSSPSRWRCARHQAWTDLQSIADARHEYYDHYLELDRRSPRSSARCPIRSTTRSSSRSSACTTTSSRA